jgi:hypothetical protein
LKALVLKLDLRKAYDCVDWEFLRLILLKIGLGIHMTKWIMSCVTSSSFVVLINGEATDFFRSGRGVRQGCPLSPLTLHPRDGRSQQITKAQLGGRAYYRD